MNSKVRVNLDYIISKLNTFDSGIAGWTVVALGEPGVTGDLIFYNSSNSYSVTVRSGVSTASAVYTLPVAAPSLPGLLQTTSEGILTWKNTASLANATGKFLVWDDDTGLGSSQKLVGGTGVSLVSNEGATERSVSIGQSVAVNADVVFERVRASTSVRTSNYYFNLTGDFPNDTSIVGTATSMTMKAEGTDTLILEQGLVLCPKGTIAGSTITPGLALYDDRDTGFFRNTAVANTLSFCANSTHSLSFNVDGLTTTKNKRITMLGAVNGSVTIGAPATGSDVTYYLPGTDGTTGQALVTNGSGSLTWATPSGTGANTALSNLASVAINTSLVSDTDKTDDLGSSSVAWLTGYINKFIMDGSTSGSVTIQTAAEAGTYTLTLPTNDGDASQVLTTNGSGVLSWTTPASSGATTALDNLASVAINTSLISDTDNTDDLGSSAKGWKDLYLKGEGYFADGTAAAPSITFGSDTDTGIYRIGANNLGVSTGGTKRLDLTTDALIYSVHAVSTLHYDLGDDSNYWARCFLGDGTQLKPAFLFGNDTDTGIYRIGDNNLGVSCGNSKVIDAKSTGVAIKGTTTNDSAAAGFVGEVVSSYSARSNFPTSEQWGDKTSISLTAGHWLISVVAEVNCPAAITEVGWGISATSGNSNTGLTIGDNWISPRGGAMGVNDRTTGCITAYEVKLSATTTYYLKWLATYSSTAPQGSGRITAQRIR